MNDEEKRILKLEYKVEQIKEDVSEIKEDVKAINNLCVELNRLSTELKISNENMSQSLKKMDDDRPQQRLGKLEIEFDELKKQVNDDKEQRRKYTYWMITAVLGTIITALLGLIL